MLQYLSERGKANVKDLPALVQAHFNAMGDMYDPINNVNGHINMGTAETRLVDKEAIELLRNTSLKLKLKPENLHYNRFEGNDEFREIIAGYWQKVIFGEDDDRKIGKENIATCAGCTVALEMLATLLADPGDIFLIPAPYYSGFADDIRDRAKVVPVAVYCGIELEKESFQSALEEEKKKGNRVRAVLFSSPNNPVGTVYKKESIQNIIEFCMENDLDLISDEIYAQTVFDKNAKWISTLKLAPKEYTHRVHVTSSFAKDFALSGFRTGFCISKNPDIIKGMATITYFSSVSSYTQAILTELIKSPELPEFMELSRTRLKEAYDIIVTGLEKIGIPTKKAEAGIFVWADFRKFMGKQEFQEEHVLWRKIYEQLKINISPGQLFCAEEPGWFRLCYAHSPSTVQEACKRLAKINN